MKRKLLIIGGSYMNVQMKIDPNTKDGDTTEGGKYSFHPHGASAVTAIAAAKVGGDCVFATHFGNDTNGKRLYEYYKTCGISNALMKKDENAQTGFSISLYSDLDTHEHFVSPGASRCFTKEEVDDAFITMPDMFLAPLEEIGVVERTVVMPAKTEKTEDKAMNDADMMETSEYTVEEIAPEETDEEATEKETEEAEKTDEEKTESPVISSETVTSYLAKESLSRYAFKKAEERNVDTVLQYTDFTAKYPLEEMKNIKILVISDEMLYKVTGFFPNNTEKALRSLVALSQKVQAKYYIVQQGDHAAFIYDGVHYDVVSAKSELSPYFAEGEGAKMHQTFMGALIADYLESGNIVRATKFAVNVSLLSRGKFGILEKVPSLAELNSFAKEHGIDLYR